MKYSIKSQSCRRSSVVFLMFLLCVAWLKTPVEAAEVTILPSEVYANAVMIEKEIEGLKGYYNITTKAFVEEVESELKPRHVWEKSDLIMVKLNLFRQKHGLPYTISPALQPQLAVLTNQTWEQTERILTELKIIRRLLNIPEKSSKIEIVSGKRSIDVFNKLNRISYEMDALNGVSIAPSFVYAEAMRLNEDINSILHRTKTIDTAAPSAKKTDATPKDSLDMAFRLMEVIQQIQLREGLEITDFAAFKKRENVVPADVLNIIGMCLAEIQTIKVRIGLKSEITPAAEIHEEKTFAEINQLLGYMTNKLRLIKWR